MPIPRIQRAFLSWLDEAQPRLLRKVIVQRRTKRAIEFIFDVGAPVLEGWLNDHEISVAVTVDGYFWDLIFDIDVSPMRVDSAFVCSSCEPSERVVYPTREALWRDHLFGLFAQWINETLAPSSALALLGKQNHATSARLFRSGPQKDYEQLLPLAPSPPHLMRPKRRRSSHVLVR